MNDKTRIIIFVGVVVVLIAGLGLLAKPSGKTSAVNSKGVPAGAIELENAHTSVNNNSLIAEEIFYDFGTISMANGLVNKKFKITNSSGTDVELPSLVTSCMCTKAYFISEDGTKKGPFGMPGMGYVPKLNAIIKSGETAYVEAEYDPNAHGPAGVGMIDRFIYLEDASGSKLQFEIKANVTP